MKFKLIATGIVLLFLIVLTVLFAGRNTNPDQTQDGDANVSMPQ